MYHIVSGLTGSFYCTLHSVVIFFHTANTLTYIVAVSGGLLVASSLPELHNSNKAMPADGITSLVFGTV